MEENFDEKFYSRADEHINLSNEQLKATDSRGKVSASMMYGVARFNAWVSACGFSSGEDMALRRDETIGYFCEQFRAMLEKNIDDYIENFASYMNINH